MPVTNRMRCTILVLLVLCVPVPSVYALHPPLSRAETQPLLSVGLEPFPPLINLDATGLSVTWLRAVAEEAGYRLQIQLMPYSRARLALRMGQVDLIGHTPKGNETPEFYRVAQELDWSVATKLDVFALAAEDLTEERLSASRIGTPLGNANFVSQLTGVPMAQFVEHGLGQLVRMLQLGRIDAIIFERASVITHLQALPATPVFYRLVAEMPAGFALHNTNTQLAHALNAAAHRLSESRLPGEGYFEAHQAFLELPDKGLVPYFERAPVADGAHKLQGESPE